MDWQCKDLKQQLDLVQKQHAKLELAHTQMAVFVEEIKPKLRSLGIELPVKGSAPSPTFLKHIQMMHVRQYAIVVGVPDRGLFNPINDAGDVAQALANHGFDLASDKRGVTYLNERHNTTRAALMECLDKFIVTVQKIKPFPIILFYFSGHGFTQDGEQYLVPSDFTTPSTGIKLADIMKMFSQRCIHSAESPHKQGDGDCQAANIFILDCCRSDGSKELYTRCMNPYLPLNTLAFFATQQMDIASDGKPGKNGLFTDAFLSALTVSPERDHRALFQVILHNMQTKYKGAQNPEMQDNLQTDFVFVTDPVTQKTAASIQEAVDKLPSGTWDSFMSVVKGSWIFKLVTSFLRKMNGHAAASSK